MRTEVVPDLPEMEREFGAENSSDGVQTTEDGAAAGETVTVGGPAENSSVTHGEGEIKPVMLENESMGGAEETALKTAPEGAGGASGGAFGGSKQITEAEARAMLIEDNARAKEDLKRANSRGKKTLVVVIALAVLLIVAGVATSIILGGMNKDNGNAGNSNKQEGSNSVVVENPEEKPEEGLVQLSLDDELVQKLYKPFTVIADQYWSPFYLTEFADGDEEWAQQRQRNGRLSIAYLNSPEEACKATFENGGLIERYGDFIANWPEEQRKSIEQCVSGEKVRQNFKEIFGYEIELKGFDDYQNKNGVTDVDSVFTEYYSPSYDEFYYGLGGAGTPAMYKHRLVRAEEKADAIYLYEQALGYYYASWAFPGDENAEFEVYDLTKKTFGLDADSLVVADTKANIEKILEGEELFNRVDGLGDLGMFKWTFRKNAAGNYVFEGLERL